jgi:ribonuclease R
MSRRSLSRTHLLDLLAEGDRPWHLREIATALGVDESEIDELTQMLEGLIEDGFVRMKGGKKFELRQGHAPRKRTEEREGVLSVNQRGFGFVSSETSRDDDVFVPAEGLRGAMHGDRVKVAIKSRGPRGVEGEITEILQRAVTRVAGVLRRRGKSTWLEPDDPRVRGPIVLPRSVDTEAGAGNSGEDGDAAIVAITRFPERPDENPEGRLEAVLGRPGELRVEEAKILAMAQIEELHHPQAITEAESYGETVPTWMLEDRVDLTHLPLPTIDPEDARDHDDAVWVERKADGGYIAWIAIADVSSYVRPGNKLDDEARARGCSIYLPSRAIPMLPRALSSNLCSLLPDQVRLCLCVEVHLDAGGKPTESRIHRGFMKSRAKLHYGGVARALGFTEEPERQPAAEAMKDDLQVAYELSKLLRGRRLKRGALDFDLPEAKIVLDKEAGVVVDVTRRSQDAGVKKAYQLIEELMLLANETVATWLVERHLPAIFRIHQPPDEMKLERLAAFCQQWGVSFDVEETKDPKSLARLLKSWADHPAASVFQMLLLRSMKQASYDIVNLGHFGLASKAYLHFTSPIRRYPDLVVHRITHAALLGEPINKGDDATEKLREAALASSTAERKAMEVERNVVDLHRAVLMREHIGERYEGTVTGLVGSGAFVSLDAPFVDVLLRFDDMAEPYEISDDGLFAFGKRSGERVSLGDRLMVEVVDAAVLRRTVYGRRVARIDAVAFEGGLERRPKRRAVVDAEPIRFGPRGRGRSASGAKHEAAKRDAKEREPRWGAPKASPTTKKSTRPGSKKKALPARPSKATSKGRPVKAKKGGKKKR